MCGAALKSLQGLPLTTQSIHYVPENLRKTPEFNELGCEPDYCAYERKMMPPMSVESLGNHRYAGGHIHISLKGADDLEVDPHLMAKAADVFLGSWMCGYTNGQRRKVMTAGRIRIKGKNYIEYRTPSNRWFLRGNTAALMVWDSLQSAMRACVTPGGAALIEEQATRAREIINAPYSKTTEANFQALQAALINNTKHPEKKEWAPEIRERELRWSDIREYLA